MKPIIKVPGIIHIFATLHAAVALSCRAAGIEDELFLTVLTMTMILLICLKKGLNTEFTASSIIVANILGYLIGNLGADILDTFISNSLTVHALSTAFTTEILGWSIVLFTSMFRKNAGASSAPTPVRYQKWVLAAMAAIFALRLCLVFLFSSDPLSSEKMWKTTSEIFSNSLLMITLVCFNLLYVRLAERHDKNCRNIVKAGRLVLFFLICSFVVSLSVSSGFPLKHDDGFRKDFPAIFVTTLLAQITTYCLVYMADYALTARTRMKEERDKANLAQYRYLKLKHQVNPHFLFNSLNILDCLVCEEKTEQASTYIHKLAGIYRYMIKSEDEQLVTMRDELEFVERYVDLLKVRFPEGLTVNTDVPEEAMAKYVLPCSIQLLIENATKHNSINPENPLCIEVAVKDNDVYVRNNLVPKVTRSLSTGLGQKYIRQLYQDISGKQIEIEKTDESYCVTLPLL